MNPCVDYCYARLGLQYDPKRCDDTCDYAKALNEKKIEEALFNEILQERDTATSRWIRERLDGVWWYECGKCNKLPLKDQYGLDGFSHFCPHCGAKMIEIEQPLPSDNDFGVGAYEFCD